MSIFIELLFRMILAWFVVLALGAALFAHIIPVANKNCPAIEKNDAPPRH